MAEQFSAPLLAEAIALVKARGQVDVDPWDASGHARAVKAGLTRAVDDHHQAEVEDLPGDALPGSWR